MVVFLSLSLERGVGLVITPHSECMLPAIYQLMSEHADLGHACVLCSNTMRSVAINRAFLLGVAACPHWLNDKKTGQEYRQDNRLTIDRF
jgi:hypothetical protein